jgi:hypothetical protein
MLLGIEHYLYPKVFCAGSIQLYPTQWSRVIDAVYKASGRTSIDQIGS